MRGAVRLNLEEGSIVEIGQDYYTALKRSEMPFGARRRRNMSEYGLGCERSIMYLDYY